MYSNSISDNLYRMCERCGNIRDGVNVSLAFVSNCRLNTINFCFQLSREDQGFQLRLGVEVSASSNAKLMNV